MKPVIGITMGDPTGIGPELVLKTLSELDLVRHNRFVLFGDYSYLFRVHRYFLKKGKRWPFRFFRTSASFFETREYRKNSPSLVPVVDLGLLENRSVTFGRVEKWAGQASGKYIQQAVRAASNGWIDGIVTLPINKESFYKAGWGKKYVDHTTMLAKLSKSRQVALMLVCGHMRAVHVTQHVPLKRVPSLISRSRVSATIELAFAALKKMGIRKPRVVVCGLNPHAGDGGVLGREEIEIINPVVRSYRRRGWSIQGPFSADVAWQQVQSRKFDAAVAMYHDQGQIPVKMFGGKVVNITLGLPFVRTSVGHGTAFDLAGKGQASKESFIESIEAASLLIKGSRN